MTLKQTTQEVERENADERDKQNRPNNATTQQNEAPVRVNQSREVKVDQHNELTYQDGQEPPKYPVRDPFRLNDRAALAQWAVSLLPIPQQVVDLLSASSLVASAAGLFLSMSTLTGQSLVSITIPNPEVAFILSFGLVMLFAGYLDVRRRAKCPNCNASFGLRTRETNRYDLSNTDEKRGEKILECTECGEDDRRLMKFGRE